MSNVFATGASGTIGKELVPLLMQSTVINRLILPTSNASKLTAAVPNSDKVTIQEGSIQDPQWVERQLIEHKVDTVFLCMGGTDELYTTMNFFSSMKRSGCVKHLVWISAGGDYLSPEFGQKLLQNCLCGHVIVKIIIEQVLQATRGPADGGFSWTIIGPTLFMENDEKVKDVIMGAGFYPDPVGNTGISRVAAKDIALGATKAIEDQGKVWGGKKVMIGTKKLYVEDDVSKLWGDVLGKPIIVQKPTKEGLEELENQARQVMDPTWGRDIRLVSRVRGVPMFDLFEEKLFNGKGFSLSDDEYEDQKRLLGREPIGYEEWVERHAAEWKREL
ncbi:MAG: hypothetical protein Q9217_002216 [Psora testacea]